MLLRLQLTPLIAMCYSTREQKTNHMYAPTFSVVVRFSTNSGILFGKISCMLNSAAGRPSSVWIICMNHHWDRLVWICTLKSILLACSTSLYQNVLTMFPLGSYLAINNHCYAVLHHGSTSLYHYTSSRYIYRRLILSITLNKVLKPTEPW